MDLRHFISNAIADINDALVDTSKRTGQLYELKNSPGSAHGVIHFDVAVAATKSGSGSAGLGIKVLALDAGVKGDIKSEHQQQSRIVFDLAWSRKSNLMESISLEEAAKKPIGTINE